MTEDMVIVNDGVVFIENKNLLVLFDGRTFPLTITPISEVARLPPSTPSWFCAMCGTENTDKQFCGICGIKKNSITIQGAVAARPPLVATRPPPTEPAEVARLRLAAARPPPVVAVVQSPLTRGTISQYNNHEGISACSHIVAVACFELARLFYENSKIDARAIDNIVKIGVQLHGGSDEHAVLDEAFTIFGNVFDEYDMFQTGDMIDAESNKFKDAFERIRKIPTQYGYKFVGFTKQPESIMLILGLNDNPSYIFDSHARPPISNFAYLRKFNNDDELIQYLGTIWKITFTEEIPEYNLYQCISPTDTCIKRFLLNSPEQYKVAAAASGAASSRDPPAAAVASMTGKKVRPPRTWKCIDCTFENSFSNDRCAICNLEKFHSIWTCPVCQYDNDIKNIICAAGCGTSKPLLGK
jgi:hypothetical protein